MNLLVSVLVLSVLVGAPRKQTFIGIISDSMCGSAGHAQMRMGPTDAVYDSAKAHGLSVRAYGERGLNTITPANASWTDIYGDWKNGTHNVNIAAQAVILGSGTQSPRAEIRTLRIFARCVDRESFIAPPRQHRHRLPR